MADKVPAVVGKFRLREKCGTHIERGEGGAWFVQPTQVVEGRSDLSKRFPERFDRVDNDRKVTATFVENAADGGQNTLAHAAVQEEIHKPKPHVKEEQNTEGPSKDALDQFETYKAMSTAELKAAAADAEIDLGDAKNKKDILDVLAQSLGIETA